MKHQDIIEQFVGLRSSLEQERQQLVARLQEIDRALDAVPTAAAAKAVRSVAPSQPVRETSGRPGGKNKMSAEGRAAIAAAQKARWAKARAGQAAAPAAKAPAKGLSKAALKAAAKVAKAPKAKAAPKKQKAGISAAGRAAIAAAQKARWAKVHAAKASGKA